MSLSLPPGSAFREKGLAQGMGLLDVEQIRGDTRLCEFSFR